MLNESVFDAFARGYEARREADMSIAEYLALCKKEPMAYANATERLLAAIGEPQMVDTAKDPRLGRIFMNRTIRAYPAFAGFYGMEETIERIVVLLPPCRPGPRRAQADPLSARPCRRRQVLARRTAEAADGGPSDLRAEGRRRDQPGLRESAQSLRSRAPWARCCEEQYGIPTRRLTRADEPLVPEAAR